MLIRSEHRISTEGLASWRPHFGTLLQVRPRDTYHFRSGMAPGLAFALFNVAGYPNQVGNFIPADFPFDWMRTMVAQLKLVRPYYYGDYYPLLPCSENSDCATDPSKERSAAFEWAAWQFNRPATKQTEWCRVFRTRGNTPGIGESTSAWTRPGGEVRGYDLDAKDAEHGFRK